MSCQHTDRKNVMFPPLAPSCHECAYQAWMKKPRGWGFNSGGTYERHGPLIERGANDYYREQRLK